MSNRPTEQEATRTTIVGGRPPGCGQPVGAIPRGIEVLIKKAAVDAEFRQALLANRSAAAGQIGLPLTAAEKMMLDGVPAGQLEAIIAGTRVPASHIPAFLGKVAALMLAAIGVATAGCEEPKSLGHLPDKPPGPATTNASPTQPATTQGVGERADNPAAPNPAPYSGKVFVSVGALVELPDNPPRVGENPNVTVLGLRIARPPTTQTQPATTQGVGEPVPPPSVVTGVRVDRPEDRRVMDGLQPDRPMAPGDGADEPVEIFGARPTRPPATTRATQPATTEPVNPAPRVIRGLMIDRPRVEPPATTQAVEPVNPARRVIHGIMIDRPRVDPPATTQAAEPPPVIEKIAGVRADQTAPENVRVLGIRPQRPSGTPPE